jgi:cytochrome c2
LTEHPALSATDAKGVTQFLMTLRPFDERIAAQTYQPGEIALRMGQMNFGKFKGCNGCHRDAPAEGGVSGPELYSAWNRLQPAFMTSFIADPLAWDPYTIMPRSGINESEVHKLVNYLKALQETQP